MLFAESGNEQYGQHVWTLKTDLPHICDAQHVIDFAAEYYGVNAERAEELVNPSNIVNTAGAWDDEQFVSDLWQCFECVGFATADGAVVLDKMAVNLVYSHEQE
jgi:hypothetical protein